MNWEIITGLTLFFAGTALMIYGMSRPNRIEICDGSLVISGSYPMTVTPDGIKTAELLDSLPKITIRTNGIALGDSMIGHFRMKGIGACRLYLKMNRPPFVHVVTTGGKHIFFNTEEPSRTRELFDALNRSKASPE